MEKRLNQAAPRYEAFGEGPIAKTHADFTEVDQFAWDDLKARASDYDAKVRDRGRRSFVLRALDEQRSLLAFSELLTQLCQSGAPVDLIGAMTRVVRDEALHVDLCDRMVKSLGGWDERVPEPNWVRANPKNHPRKQQIITMIGSLCIGETISVQMIRGVRDNASDPVAYKVLTRMLADESYHGRVGWWWLEQTKLNDRERDFAQRLIARALPSLEESIIPKPSNKPHKLSPFGSLSREDRIEAFENALHKVILPGFDKAGLEGTAIWNKLKAA